MAIPFSVFSSLKKEGRKEGRNKEMKE